MIHRRIAKIKLRKGIASEADNIAFNSGELVYITDKAKLNVGDGTTKSGVTVGNRNYIVNTSTVTIPKKAGYGDIIFNPVAGKTVILDKNNNGNLIPLVIADDNCFDYYREQIKLMLAALSGLTGCLVSPPPPPPPPPIGVLTWVIQPSDVITNIGDLATFTVSAVGPGTITYQWSRKDTGQLIGKTSNILRINPVTPTDFAQYQCVATDSIVGTASSNVAYLSEFVEDIAFSTTNSHALVLGVDGTLSAWGENSVGQLGDGTKKSTYVPIKINLPKVKSIGTCFHGSFGLGFDGTLSAWGHNCQRQFARTYATTSPNRTDSTVPIKVDLPAIKEIYINGDSAFIIFALGVDGTLSAWGSNTYGQTEKGTFGGIGKTPIKINSPPLEKIYIHKNIKHFFGLGVDGTLSAWGQNDLGQLGIGTTTSSLSPIKINLPPVKEMSLELGASYALGVDGTLSAWGTTIGSTVPVKINLPQIKQIASSSNASYALGVDGTLSAWGINNYGQLGNGTFINSSTPIKINLPPVKKVYAYYNSCYAVGFDGTLSGWGFENFGKGIGSNIPIKTDIQPFKITKY